jgi:hypothetical protein
MDPLGESGAPQVGWIYKIEGFVNGKPAVYTGSAADIKNRLSNKHHWSELIKDKRTKISVKRIFGDLDVQASNRKSYMSARNEALRSAEQQAMDDTEEKVKKRRKNKPEILNKDQAASKGNKGTWKDRHNVSSNKRWRVIKKPGAPAIMPKAFSLLAVVDFLKMTRDEKLSQYRWAPYVLEDEKGAFALAHETRWWFVNTYYKMYVTGESKGEKEEIESSEFKDLKEEAEALWGTTDWKGDFVPGLLNPELPGPPCA